MKVVAVSDIHGKGLELMNPCGADVCMIAGDIAPLKSLSMWDVTRQYRWVREKFCPFMESHAGTEFVFVAGNHDFWGETFSVSDPCWPRNAHYLKNGKVVLSNGLSVWGTPLVNPIGSARRWAFEMSEKEQAKVFDRIPVGVDVIVSHNPPTIEGSDIDVPVGCQGMHLGSKALADAVLRVKPKMLVCGHIHTGAHGKFMLGGTECRNVSVLDEDYRVAYGQHHFSI